MLADKGSNDDRLGLPELTLIGAAATSATTRLAAHEVGAVAAPKSSPGDAGAAKEDSIDELAEAAYNRLLSMIDAENLRRGN